MAGGAPLDMQRAARWPSQETQVDPRGTKSLSVDWAPHQVDSDYDDMEGLYPRPPGTQGNNEDDGDGAWLS